MHPAKMLALRGVRVPNLKNIDVDIPLHRLTVVTGVSGAGKSSLVFDTLYAEAQRRYLQSFSVYTRQFLERFDKPDADTIGDLPPAVAIRRTSASTSSRVTVGSLAEIDPHLRLLFARAGVVVCPGCGQRVPAHRAEDVLVALQAMQAGTHAAIAFPVDPTLSDRDIWQSLLEEGYHRIQIGDKIYRLDEESAPPLKSTERAWVLLDRIEIGKTPAERVRESTDAAFRRGNGRLGVLTDNQEIVFDQRHFCPRCDRLFPAPTPRLFDPGDPLGACGTCDGTGTQKKSPADCPACNGSRFNADALAVRFDDLNIADWQSLTLSEATQRIEKVQEADEGANVQLAQLRSRLQTLAGLDLGHLALRQPASTLADGALRRIALASALASNLVNVLYLIDEPTVGLHARDIGKLCDALTQLRNRGNTVVVIEHERAILAVADHVIDLGPSAGEDGGNVTYHGPPNGLTTAAEYPTSDFWTGRSYVECPERRRTPTGWLKLSGVSTNNLQNLDVAFPLGILCAVTGVSGSGKRSLVEESLYPALCLAKKKKSGAVPHPRPLSQGERGEMRVAGAHQINDVVLLDQTPLTRSARSNAATYLKIFDEIRDLFSQAIDAKIRNYAPGHFSFNQPGGRCETCEGQGSLNIDMQFLADVRTICPDCHGRRYRKEILAIKVRSLSIAEVLDLTVREAFRFFRAQPAIEKKLKVLLDVGLEYVRLGQAVETLSGSACQRLKLAGHLASSRKTGCLFLLIEPSAGLHPSDVVNLLDSFERLLTAGHSLIVVENDSDIIKSADWVIELGPEGGKNGGRIVAAATPE